MLIQLTDADGRETWINPIHVKIIRTRKGMLGGGKGTEVWFSFIATSEAVYFSEPPAVIAQALNAAMPTVVALTPDDDDQTTPPPQHAG